VIAIGGVRGGCMIEIDVAHWTAREAGRGIQ
jgi:hypothetical protein